MGLTVKVNCKWLSRDMLLDRDTTCWFAIKLWGENDSIKTQMAINCIRSTTSIWLIVSQVNSLHSYIRTDLTENSKTSNEYTFITYKKIVKCLHIYVWNRLCDTNLENFHIGLNMSEFKSQKLQIPLYILRLLVKTAVFYSIRAFFHIFKTL